MTVLVLVFLVCACVGGGHACASCKGAAVAARVLHAQAPAPSPTNPPQYTHTHTLPPLHTCSQPAQPAALETTRACVRTPSPAQPLHVSHASSPSRFPPLSSAPRTPRTYPQGQPPFQWSADPRWAGMEHRGQPDVFNFTWEAMRPKVGGWVRAGWGGWARAQAQAALRAHVCVCERPATHGAARVGRACVRACERGLGAVVCVQRVACPGRAWAGLCGMAAEERRPRSKGRAAAAPVALSLPASQAA